MFCSIFLSESICIKNFRKFHQTVWILPIFFIFKQFWLFFGKESAKKGRNPKKLFCSIFFLLESIYISNFRKFHQTVLILAIIFSPCFLVKKRPKKAEIQKKFFCSIFFIEKRLHTEFQKFHQTIWNLPILFIFGQFRLFFG